MIRQCFQLAESVSLSCAVADFLTQISRLSINSTLQRFGIEGCEAVLPGLEALAAASAAAGVRRIEVRMIIDINEPHHSDTLHNHLTVGILCNCQISDWADDSHKLCPVQPRSIASQAALDTLACLHTGWRASTCWSR